LGRKIEGHRISPLAYSSQSSAVQKQIQGAPLASTLSRNEDNWMAGRCAGLDWVGKSKDMNYLLSFGDS